MRKVSAEAVHLVGSLCSHIRSNPDTPHTLASLGRRAGLSPAHLQRLFKRVTGISPRQFADSCRLDRLKNDLRGGRTVTTAMYSAGYGSSSRLYEKAAEHLGMTPGQYRSGGSHAMIRYTITDCYLGRVLLAATSRGVCALSLADCDAELIRHLGGEFPSATIARDDKGLAPWLTELLRHLAGATPHPDLPLDVRGTAFQRQVWEELRRIPYGETRSYQQVAQAIGKPLAARAVARACATNPAAVVIPCHRVIGADGSLCGYAYGVTRKTKLLAREHEEAPDQDGRMGKGKAERVWLQQ